MHPASILCGETVEFIRRHLGRGSRFLRVGCLDRWLSDGLRRVGFEVDALEPGAGREGVAPHEFDAVLFDSCLHREQELDATLEWARAILRPSGLLLVEGLAHDEVDAGALEWLDNVAKLLIASDALEVKHESLIGSLVQAGGTQEAWQELHLDHTHTATTMLQAIEARFQLHLVESVPYLYRYFATAVPADNTGAAIVGSVLALERHLRRRCLVGRRFVATNGP